MVNKNLILDHAQVVDINGEHVGIVDHLADDDKIKLAKSDPEAGSQHHLIPLSWVKNVDDNKVILSKVKADAEREWEGV